MISINVPYVTYFIRIIKTEVDQQFPEKGGCDIRDLHYIFLTFSVMHKHICISHALLAFILVWQGVTMPS